MAGRRREIGGVTGREYGRRRKKGWAPWDPTPRIAALLEQVLDVFATYQQQLPLTIRQVLYVLMGRGVLTKDAEGSLNDLLTNARRSRKLNWRWVRDSRVSDAAEYPEPGWPDVDSYLLVLRDEANDFELHPSLDQPIAVEVWCEAAGMAPQLARVANPLGAGVYPSGGDKSFTRKAEAAERITDRGKPTVILIVGDYDSSGQSIIDSYADDVAALVDPSVELTFEHVAVLPEHKERWKLPTAPGDPEPESGRPAPKGGRMAWTVQAEAIPPDELANLVREAILRYVDQDVAEATAQRSTEARQQLVARMERLRDPDAEGDG